MSEHGINKESPGEHIKGEFIGLVGLVGDVIVDVGSAMQEWSARRFAAWADRNL